MNWHVRLEKVNFLEDLGVVGEIGALGKNH